MICTLTAVKQALQLLQKWLSTPWREIETAFGAFIDERIVGFATVSHHIFGAKARYAELVCFQVSGEYRHQGIGTRVVREAETWARELGYAIAVVESRDNKIPFYESMDYVADFDRKIEGETFTCFRMEKNLADSGR